MTIAILTPSRDPNVQFVKSVQGGSESPDPRNPKFQPCPNDVTGLNAAGEYTWTYDNEIFRRFVYNDRFAGWTLQQQKNYAKQALDQWFWKRVASVENPFNLGYPVWPEDNEDELARTYAINEVLRERREYLAGPSDPDIDTVLGLIVPFYQAMKDAYPVVWTDIKQQNIQLNEFDTHPSWPVVPGFTNEPDEDKPNVPLGSPPKL